jgi:phage baseplate assembly protein W
MALYDLNAPWGGDLSLSQTGGLELITGLPLATQRLIRRLLTNLGAYIFEPTYGAGLGRFVGQPINEQAIAALVTSQAEQEDTIASVTSVTVTANTISSYGLTIVFVAANTSAQQVLSFTVTPVGATGITLA